MLKPVTIIKVEPCPTPHFSIIELVTAERDGQEIKWEMSAGHDTVHIAVFNTTTQKLLYVKQIRIPVLVKDPLTGGAVVECCAGLIDKKDKSINQIALEEVEEELGFVVQPENLHFFSSLKSSVGKAGITSHMFWAEVSDEDRVFGGGGLDSEDIEIVEIDVGEASRFISGVTTDATTVALTLMTLNTLKREGLIK